MKYAIGYIVMAGSAVAAEAVKAPLSEKLTGAFINAYGRPLKFALIIVLCIVVGGPVLMFVKRMIR